MKVELIGGPEDGLVLEVTPYATEVYFPLFSRPSLSEYTKKTAPDSMQLVLHYRYIRDTQKTMRYAGCI